MVKKMAAERLEIRGFTLVELMVAVAISSITMAGILTAFITYMRAADRAVEFAKTDVNSQLNIASSRLMRGTTSTPGGLHSFNGSSTKITKNDTGWEISDTNNINNVYRFNRSAHILTDFKGAVMAKDIIDSDVSRDKNLIFLTIKVQAGGRTNESTKIIQLRNRG